MNNVVVISEKTDKKSIEDFGTPDKVLSEQLSFLFGKQAFAGEPKGRAWGRVGGMQCNVGGSGRGERVV